MTFLQKVKQCHAKLRTVRGYWFLFEPIGLTLREIRPLKIPGGDTEFKKAIDEVVKSKDHFEWLYGALNVLDTKASGLLGFNALLIAAVSLLIQGQSVSGWALGFFIAGLVFLARGSFEALFILHMRWPWLAAMRKPQTDQNGVPIVEEKRLREEADLRACRYRGSWRVTILGTWLLVFGVAAMLASSCCAANPQDGQAMPGRDVPTLLQALPERARATLVAAASAPTFTGVFENALVERALAAAPELTREALMLGLLPLARSYAVVPTSSYQVGAVAEGQSGALYLGANLEPKGLPLGFTMHAEQSAVAQAHAGAEKAIRRLAITAAPCGYCRQFLNDLVGGAELAIVVAGSGKPAATTLKSLLPDAFGPRDLAVDGALLAHAKWNLRLLEGKHSAAVLSAVEAAARSYSPYTKCPSGVALRAAGGAIVAGSYIENAAYNPSLSPLLAALNLARFRGIAWDGVNEVVLVELQRAVAGSGAISQEQHCRLLAEKLLPKARLQVVRCE